MKTIGILFFDDVEELDFVGPLEVFRDRGARPIGAVRKKAIFWLGQKHDPRALAAIEDILKR